MEEMEKIEEKEGNFWLSLIGNIILIIGFLTLIFGSIRVFMNDLSKTELIIPYLRIIAGGILITASKK